MNLKRSLYTMVGLGLVGTSLLAAISLWGDAQQERALADMQEKASWLRLQLTSDMMHDAMRGDVLEALRIAKNPLATATEKDALLADADEHASNFISNMNELQQAKLPDAVKQKSDEVALALIQYRNSTNDIIATALKQPTRAETLWPAFMQQFRQLETSMAEFSDVLEQSIKSSQTQVVKDNQRLTGIFYSTVALIIFVLLICAQIIIRRVFKTLGGEPEVASRIVRQISQGEFNVQIPEVPSQSLLDQMRQMTTSLANFVQAQQHLAQQHVAGVRSARLDCAGLSGGFAHMAEQVNLLIEGKERLLDEVLAHIRCYVQGDFTQPMRALPQELMAVTQAVNSTRQGLATAAKSFIENARIRVALDSVDTNVLVVDPDRQIIYCNPAFVSMLSNHASLLGRELTGLNTQQPIGQSLHVFQPQTGPRLALFNDITQAHQANLSIGGLHFVLSSNPILSATGEHLGLVIEFVDRTPMVQIENEVARVLAAAAKGDFSQQISLTAKEGFFLNLSNSINQLQAGVTHSLAELAAALAALAKGDLTRSMQGQFDGAFAQIQTSCNGTVASLTRLLRIIADAALQIRSSSNEIAVGNQNLSQRTEEQATSLEETASAMDELTSAVKHNNDHAQQASQLAQHASEMAQQGGLVVNSVVTTMRDIQHSSHKIVEIISVIDGIAFQTNILALNAAVEAARAGEQGRGFAVVAAEVRSLAQRSAAAAKEIATLIEISVDKVESGTRQVDAAGKTMGNIIQSVSQVTEIIIGISSASHEQTTGIQQVSQTIAQMDNMTQQNAALVEQAAAASEHLREQAETMAQIVGQFILDDD